MTSFFGAAFVRRLLDSIFELEVFPFEVVAAGVTNPSLPLAISYGCDIMLLRADSTWLICFDFLVRGESGLAVAVS